MKSITILNKIKKDGACSIHTAGLLTSALHREKKLPELQAIRFRPFFGDFDIVNADLFVTHEFDNDLCECKPMSIDELIERFR